MADLWGYMRSEVLNLLNEEMPELPFEDRVIIAEETARGFVEQVHAATRFLRSGGARP